MSVNQKVHKPKIIGVTALLMCRDCGMDLPVNYLCPWCRWDQVFSDDHEDVLEICIPCPLHVDYQ